MIETFRVKGRIVLAVESGSGSEAALLGVVRENGINLKPQSSSGGVSRYVLTRPEEGRFNEYLRVVFRKWPRAEGNRVRAELRRMNGDRFCCESDRKGVHLRAPQEQTACVRCALHAGAWAWVEPGWANSTCSAC